MKKVAIILGAFLWGISVFRIALGIHFPTEELGQTIRSEFEKSTGNKMQLGINDLSLSGFLGLEASQATIYKNGADDQATPLLFVDSLSVALSPFQAIQGALGAHISSNILNGLLEADISGDSFNPKSIGLTWEASALSLDLVPVELEKFSANLGGKLSSTSNLKIMMEEPHKTLNGKFAINIDDFAISEAKAQGIALPDLKFSEATLKGKAKDGKITLDGTSFVSESIGIELSGNIVLAKRIERSRLRLTVDITLGPEFNLISKIIPELKQNKQADGTYKLNIVGTIKNPRIRGGKSKSKKGNNSKKKNLNKSEAKGFDKAEMSSVSPEERRKQRRERMERRKKTRKNKATLTDESDELNAEAGNRPSMTNSRVKDLPFTSRGLTEDDEDIEEDENEEEEEEDVNEEENDVNDEEEDEDE